MQTRLSLAAIVYIIAQIIGPSLVQAQQVGSFGSWGLACRALGPSETRCALFQRQVNEANALVLEVQILGLERAGTPQVTASVPMGVWLAADLTMQVDRGAEVRQRFERCSRQGCIGRIQSPDLLTLLEDGRQITFGYATGPDPTQAVKVTLSLIGIREGIAAIQAPDTSTPKAEPTGSSEEP